MLDNQIQLRLRKVYNELEREFNFIYNDYLEIGISKRLRSKNGQCYYYRDRITGEVSCAIITMSKALLEEFGWDVFENTFRHEVAHLANAITGGKGHDKSFKRLCRDFGGKMNKGLAGYEFADCASSDYVKPIVKWIYTCPCGYKKKMSKRMKKSKRGNSIYSCGKCGNGLHTWTEKRVG